MAWRIEKYYKRWEEIITNQSYDFSTQYFFRRHALDILKNATDNFLCLYVPSEKLEGYYAQNSKLSKEEAIKLLHEGACKFIGNVLKPKVELFSDGSIKYTWQR